MAGKSLEQLENLVWDESKFDSTLVATCHRLRKKPIDAFTVEDLRIMIGQNIGLPHLIPRAIDILERQPLAQGDCYPGDLLVSVAGCEQWLLSRPGLVQRLVVVAERALSELGMSDQELVGLLKAFLTRNSGST